MIPVSVVTGFLGSGKTTLIRAVLAHRGFSDTAVIVNEFGEIGLDHALIEHSDEDLLTLSTGCLCCAARGDLIRTLLDLDRRRARGAIAYARVLIETSGLADPAPVLQALLADADLARGHAVDTVLTVVDGAHGKAALIQHPEARRQVSLADVIVLAKSDLGPPAQALLDGLDVLNGAAPRIPASHGAIQPALLFSGGGAEARAARLAALPPPEAASPFVCADHTDAVTTFALVRDALMPALALTLLLEALAEHGGERLLRVKGLVGVEEMPDRPALIQGVRHVFAPPDFLPAWPHGDRRTRLVFIARNMPRHFPARLLNAIEAEVRDEGLRR